jgi:hypothetical protein
MVASGVNDAVVLVDLQEVVADAFGDLAKFALLICGRLIDCRDPKVENSAFHGVPPWLITRNPYNYLF